MKSNVFTVVTICLLIGCGVLLVALYSMIAPSTAETYVGFRCNGEHTPEYWVSVTERYTSLIPDTAPGGIWIIPESKVLSFDSVTDAALTVLDNNGVKVLLQVGDSRYVSTVDQLIDATLGNYGHHPCVLGFGIDCEMLGESWDDLVPVTDAEAERWVNKIKGYNSNFKLFLKHWLTAAMPPTVRKDIVFIDDAQQFGGYNEMLDRFKSWGNKFSQSDVGFQIGYPSDEWWWSKLANPPKDWGLALLNDIPNCKFILWVNFSVKKVFP